MKKILLCALFAVLAGSAVNAQEQEMDSTQVADSVAKMISGMFSTELDMDLDLSDYDVNQQFMHMNQADTAIFMAMTLPVPYDMAKNQGDKEMKEKDITIQSVRSIDTLGQAITIMNGFMSKEGQIISMDFFIKGLDDSHSLMGMSMCPVNKREKYYNRHLKATLSAKLSQ